MYNIGVIGCGKIAQLRHLPEYQANAAADIKAVCDSNYARAKEVAEKYGARAYRTYEEILALPDIDAVSVCTANFAHAEITIAALNAGKHVLCEKPMALDLKSCEDMVRAAEKNGKHLLIGHNQRLLAAHQKAGKLIREGAIGKIITVRSVFAHSGPETWSIDSGSNTWFFDKNKAIMGVMADLGIHKTDLVHYLTGQNAVSVTAFADTLDKKKSDGTFIDVEDNAFCIYQLSKGAAASVSVSWSCYGEEDNSTVIYGSQGTMKIFAEREHAIVIEQRSGQKIFYDFEEIQTNDRQSRSGVIDLFIDSLSGNGETILDGRNALQSMRAVFAAMESARSGKSVLIGQEDI